MQPEIMDQADLDETGHRRALNGLSRVNLLSLSSRVFWPMLRRRSEQKAGRTVRVLDLACGGGDVAVGLAKRAARENVAMEVTGYDLSPLAVKMANERAESAGYDHVTFNEANVLHDPIPDGFDVVMCSLFLHHLDQNNAVALLKKMAAATQGDLLVNDLRRSRSGYWLAWLGCRVLSRSPIVHFDGPTSVAAAYTIPEVLKLTTLAGIEDPTIIPFWPERFLLAWSKT